MKHLYYIREQKSYYQSLHAGKYGIIEIDLEYELLSAHNHDWGWGVIYKSRDKFYSTVFGSFKQFSSLNAAIEFVEAEMNLQRIPDHLLPLL